MGVSFVAGALHGVDELLVGQYLAGMLDEDGRMSYSVGVRVMVCSLTFHFPSAKSTKGLQRDKLVRFRDGPTGARLLASVP